MTNRDHAEPTEITILKVDKAKDPDLPSHLFPGCGSDGAEFKVTRGPILTEKQVSKLLYRTISDACLTEYDENTGTGYFRVVDGDAPDAGTVHVLRDDSEDESIKTSVSDMNPATLTSAGELAQEAICRIRALAKRPLNEAGREHVFQVADAAHNIPLAIAGNEYLRQRLPQDMSSLRTTLSEPFGVALEKYCIMDQTADRKPSAPKQRILLGFVLGFLTGVIVMAVEVNTYIQQHQKDAHDVVASPQAKPVSTENR